VVHEEVVHEEVVHEEVVHEEVVHEEVVHEEVQKSYHMRYWPKTIFLAHLDLVLVNIYILRSW
jgi:hypothetical protein